ncbi:rifin PIR protein, putative [Plasmodium reichenowi]|uniref:Rifin PIR protein, putative n=1 Tax=Plasmodium reichenowi TaxID=5854 RepID=A0A2P9DBG0_PLARE|nr:rifin PIR protein, putative [Plasmodium reichenowi]
MKVHYINILLFALPLNILANNKNKLQTTRHIPKIPTNRLLCECELYEPVNYDNDPQMKEVMDNFNKQTQQRLREYDDRMQEKRQKCKHKCDKEIQKIILKDKLEKQMEQQLTTLNTNIATKDIPTCICEKSMADKTEKICLNCGKTMGGVAPGWGLVSGLVYAGWTNYITEIAMQKGIEEGVKWGIQELKDFFSLKKLISISEIENLINHTNYANKTTYVTFIKGVKSTKCVDVDKGDKVFCDFVNYVDEQMVERQVSVIARDAAYMAESTEAGVLSDSAPATNVLTTAITSSIIAIVVIVLIMVIIYLILRYRRKKKMKKKLQYIKLLEE